MENAHIEAHKHSIRNMPNIKPDSKCGCFYCLAIFDSSEIIDTIPDNPDTAVCPYCYIDSVINESSGYPITEEFLGKMREHWFNI